MNETIGPLNPDVMGNIGKQLNNDIMTRCKDIIEDIENQTIKILKKYKQHMETIAKDLLENETSTDRVGVIFGRINLNPLTSTVTVLKDKWYTVLQVQLCTISSYLFKGKIKV